FAAFALSELMKVTLGRSAACAHAMAEKAKTRHVAGRHRIIIFSIVASVTHSMKPAPPRDHVRPGSSRARRWRDWLSLCDDFEIRAGNTHGQQQARPYRCRGTARCRATRSRLSRARPEDVSLDLRALRTRIHPRQPAGT